MNANAEAIAFASVFDDCYSPISAYAMRRLPNAAEAEDVVSEVFTTAWRRWAEVSQMSNPLPWLYRTAHNVVLNKRRSAARHLRLVDKVGAQPQRGAPGPDAFVDDEVRIALDQLADADREVLQLVAWEGLSLAEAGEVLGCSANAVGLRISRARKRLAQFLEPNPSLDVNAKLDANTDLNANTVLNTNQDRSSTDLNQAESVLP